MSTNRNTIPIYYNVDTKQLSDSSGAGISSAYTPVITYKTYPVLLLNFVDSSGNPQVFPEGMTFKAAIDTDYNIATDLVCKSQDTDINQGDWAGESLAQGRISVRVSANTIPFGTRIGAAASISAMLEVTGWVTIDIGGTPMPVRTFIATIPVILSNLVDAEDGTSPEELPGDYYTIAQVEARLKEGYELSFSEDGSSWHTTQTSADLYWRYRYPNGVWSGAITFGTILQLGETETTAYRGDHGKAAYNRIVWFFTSHAVGNVSSAVTLDAADGHMQEMTVTAAVTSLTVSNLGADYPRVEITVDNTGGHTFDLGTGWTVFGTVPTGAAIFQIVVGLLSDGTTQIASIGAGSAI
jgi:hypothetical protein